MPLSTLLARPGAIASLAQLVLKLTVPGVPDIYQGGELWDFSLVDPDNRRPVDWVTRRAMLREIGAAAHVGPRGDWNAGREKLFVTHRLLELRRHHTELFAAGDYLPLDATGGQNGDHLCAFARRHGEEVSVIAVPRLVHGLYRDGATADWGATGLTLPDHPGWRDVLTGREWIGCERILVSDLLADFPVAVLMGVSQS